MGDYQRSTRECNFNQLRPEIQTALFTYIEKHELGEISNDVQLCWETTSEKKKKGLFGSLLGSDPDPYHVIGIILTSHLLFWIRYGPKSGSVVSFARLKDITIRDFSYDQVDDTGIEVFGLINYFPERATAFIGLGKEMAADQLRASLKEAVNRVNH